MTLFVNFKRAVTSDAKKFSLSPTPITSGLSFLAPTSFSGSSSQITTIAYDPWIFLSEEETACSKLPLYSSSIKCAIISESVCEVNM